MFDVTCLDSFGNVVNTFTQWDINQTLHIEDSGFDIAPVFHFCNQNTEKALCVQSEFNPDGVLTVKVPNQLLIEPYPITAYVYMGNGDSFKTIEYLRFPLRTRPQPNDFLFAENIEVVWLQDLIKEVVELSENVTEAETERLQNENIRITNENTRIQAENEREAAEALRKKAETERIAEFGSITDAFNNKIAEANQIIEDNGNAKSNADAAAASEKNASESATESAGNALLAKSWAIGGTGTRANEDADNARYYAEQAEQISQGLAGAMVTGIKGIAENTFRRGNVEIGPEDLGITVVNNTEDAAKNVFSAGRLTAPRAINGTAFDGSKDITTESWGAARSITVGASSKPVDGASDVGWTLEEIGAIPSSKYSTIEVRSSDPGAPVPGQMWIIAS